MRSRSSVGPAAAITSGKRNSDGTEIHAGEPGYLIRHGDNLLSPRRDNRRRTRTTAFRDALKGFGATPLPTDDVPPDPPKTPPPPARTVSRASPTPTPRRSRR